MPKITLEEAQAYLDAPALELGKNAKDLSGQRFGYGVVIKPVFRKYYNYQNNTTSIIHYLLKCDCGNYYTTATSHLIRNNTMSCGCYNRKCTIDRNKDKKINTKRAKSRRQPNPGNSLAEKCPDSLKYWDYDKNNGITPYNINACNGDKKYWFKCELGHSYDMLSNDFQKGHRCRYCSGQAILQGFNDLLTLEPELCKEWDYEKNELGPENYTRSSKYKAWWKCKRCGHKLKRGINSRTYGNNNGCPKCNSSKGEAKIDEFLSQNNILYIKQHKFPDCKNINPLPFDHYLPHYNLCIEYNGRQHYEIWEVDNYSVEGLKQRKKHDRIKKQYCKQNNIEFLPIKYTQFNEIETLIQKKLKSITEYTTNEPKPS